ncbi:MAG: DHHA1 domain-containing protein [Halobacteriales archaeon]|nr:DHHA1 domain-containing protein [Halobacteriales archaeon]
MSVEEAVERIASSEFVRIVAHADADGVSSAACLCSALSSLGIGYHFTALEDPSDAGKANADVFCDLGAAYLDRMDTTTETVVIDHHPPRGTEGFDGVLVGTDAPSSSVTAYRVAREIGAVNPVTALVGAVGDGVSLDDEDVSYVVEDAVETGVEHGEGVRIVGENYVEALAYSTRPFTRLSGNYDEARSFIDEVDEDDISTAVVLLALTQEGSRPNAVAELVGDLYHFPSGVHLHELARYVEACAVSGKHGLALSLCLDTGAHLEEAREVWRAFESSVIEKVRGAKVEEGENRKPAFARTHGGFDTGAVADALYDWVTGDIVVVNEDGEASFRADSFDCGRVARESARAVGGEGGGHTSRAGASFSASDVSRDEFFEAVRRAIRQ